MKIIQIFFISLVLISILTGCGRVENPTSVIFITNDTGDRQNHLILGTDDSSIYNSYQNDRFLKESIELFYGASKYKLEPKILDYLSEYAQKNCHIVNSDIRKAIPAFTIRIYSTDKLLKCYLYDREVIIEYFEGMITWLNNSPYKEDCKDVISHLERFVKYRRNL